MTRKVVVFGIDGVRLDTLRAADTPNLDAIAAAGFLASVRIPDINPTISGPCWATIATGVHADEHLILGNNLSGHRLADYPCFLARGTDAGLSTYAAAGWPPLLTADSHGPIFRPKQQFVPPRPPGAKTGGDAEGISDTATIDAAAIALSNDDIDLAFVYLGQVDEVGHEYGTDDAYLAAVERADAEVGRIKDAIAARDSFAAEEWTYLAVTDHGHRDGGGHGGDSDLERTAWIAGCGPGLGADSGEGVGHADVARLALAPLGVR